jgi:hypothetical protein
LTTLILVSGAGIHFGRTEFSMSWSTRSVSTGAPFLVAPKRNSPATTMVDHGLVAGQFHFA